MMQHLDQDLNEGDMHVLLLGHAGGQSYTNHEKCIEYEGQTAGLAANCTDPALNQQVTAHRPVGESGSYEMNEVNLVVFVPFLFYSLSFCIPHTPVLITFSDANL